MTDDLKSGRSSRRMVVAAVVLTYVVSACSGYPHRTDPRNITKLEPELKAFFAAKEQQARAFQTHGTNEVPPELWPYFDAAAGGKWGTVTRFYFQMARRSNQFEDSEEDVRLLTPIWQTVNETYRTYEQLAAANPKYALAFGREVIDSIPRGSIYFGGTDAGRFLVTFLSKSHEEGDPFFVLTQNALADALYLDYLRAIYADKISIPSPEDSTQAYSDYLVDAIRRKEQNQIKPGEQVEMVGGQAHVSGKGAIMEINARLAKIIFDSNPQREFFLDQGYGMDWTYPHLVPHGLIFKINREPLVELDEESIRRDRAYWSGYVAKLIGNWLTEQTSIPDICAFGEKVFLRKDLSGFTGDPDYTRTARAWTSLPDFLGAAAVFSRSRAEIAKLYFWRAQNAKSTDEQERMLKEMDFAVRQALALCPYQPEAVYWCVTALANRKRWDDAFLVLRTAGKYWPNDKYFSDWAKPLNEWLESQANPDGSGARDRAADSRPLTPASP